MRPACGTPSGHQRSSERSSEVISGHQRSSAVITCVWHVESRRIRGHQQSSAVISGHHLCMARREQARSKQLEQREAHTP